MNDWGRTHSFARSPLSVLRLQLFINVRNGVGFIPLLISVSAVAPSQVIVSQ